MRQMITDQSMGRTGFQQEREKVRKEMIAGPFSHRLHTVVLAEKSLVEIEKKDKGYDLIEKLSGVSYLTQESVSPRHLVRVIKADHAVYHYSDERITADRVAFTRYLLADEKIPSSFEGVAPLMQGSGDQLKVDLKGERKYSLSRARGQIFQVQ